MNIDPFMTEMFMKERVEEALREAEHARLVKIAQGPKESKPFLLAATQILADWWDGRLGAIRMLVENQWRREVEHNSRKAVK